MFPVITIPDSVPNETPRKPAPARLHRSGGRNIKNLEMSLGAWALRHAETKQLAEEGASLSPRAVTSPTKALASTLPDPLSPRPVAFIGFSPRPVASPMKALSSTLPDPLSPRLVASPMKASSSTLSESAGMSVPENSVHPAESCSQTPLTPTLRSSSQSELEHAGAVQSTQDWGLLVCCFCC